MNTPSPLPGKGGTPEVTPEVVELLRVMEGEMSRREIMDLLGLKDEKHFREHYQQRAIKAGVIELTIPDKPTSRLQKYRRTALGRTIVQTHRKP
ncbi:Fic family protein [Desulfobulbus propionicus]